MKIKRVVLLLFMFMPSLILKADEPLNKNLEIYKKLSSEIAVSVLEKISPDSTNIVILNSVNQSNAANWIVQNAFVQQLLEKNIKIEVQSKAKTDENFVIEYLVTQTNLKYSLVPGTDKIERQLNFDVDIKSTRGKQGSVLFLKTFQKEYLDQVPAGEIKELESDAYPFTISTVPYKKSFKRYIEPFIVLTTTALIIYSFFILRSK